MDQKSPPHPDVLTQIRELLGLGSDPSALPALGRLERYTRRQLLDCAERLGLTGLSRLTKDAIAARFEQALRALGVSMGMVDAPGEPGERADLPRKFDLGLATDKQRAPEHIPWGYGQDRVTAMVVDPDRLYVYWEATDDAISRARQQLGAPGQDAWLNLRVYDVTDRIFDGTNARDYFDHKVERGDRQWFFHVGRPTSTVCVELGLKSSEGFFVRIARSGRADFPRQEPAAATDVEWLTVHAASGEVGPPTGGGPPTTRAEPTAPPAGLGRTRDIRDAHALPNVDATARGEASGARSWQEVAHGEWIDGGRVFVWEGPVTHTSWEAGPFSFAVESPVYIEERHDGRIMLHHQNGRTHMVYGPWQVVIRGLGAHAERRILGHWEISRSWTTDATLEVRGAAETRRLPGGSEALLLGASELRRGAASEIRLGGASEIHRIGASERRYLGASEIGYAGASEWHVRGASEWRYGGASEVRAGGGSEQRLGGASEARPHGAGEAAPAYPAPFDADHEREPPAPR